MKTWMIRLFCASLMLPAASLAASYQAYNFADPTLASRTDLLPLLKYRSTTISDQAAARLTSFEVKGVRWSMDREVFDFLSRVARVSATTPLPSELTALAQGDVSLDSETLSSPAGQIRTILKPLASADVADTLTPLFADPDFITAAQKIAATKGDLAKLQLTEAQKMKFAFLQGALMWRLRGGGLYVKTSGSQTWRYLFTVRPMMTLAELGGASRSFQIGGEFWAGLLQSWGRYFDIGRFPNQEDRYRDLAEMTRIGSRIGDAVADDLESRGYDASPLRIAGRQFAGCYDYAWENLGTKVWGNRSTQPYVEIAAVPTQWAELCAGASFASALMRTLLDGPRRK